MAGLLLSLHRTVDRSDACGGLGLVARTAVSNTLLISSPDALRLLVAHLICCMDYALFRVSLVLALAIRYPAVTVSEYHFYCNKLFRPHRHRTLSPGFLQRRTASSRSTGHEGLQGDLHERGRRGMRRLRARMDPWLSHTTKARAMLWALS